MRIIIHIDSMKDVWRHGVPSADSQVVFMCSPIRSPRKCFDEEKIGELELELKRDLVPYISIKLNDALKKGGAK